MPIKTQGTTTETASGERVTGVQRPVSAGYVALYLLGSCANGNESDKGRLVHAVPTDSARAICGLSYGRRSAGWQSPEVHGEPTQVTCPSCLRRLAKAKGAA